MMNGIDTIIQRLNTDAKAETDALLEKARQEAAAVAARYQAQADKEVADLAARNERLAAEREERLISAAQMEARKTVLAAKQAVMEETYAKALEKKNKAEDITRVLYPNDSTWEGKRLRIKQQYVLSSASLQDMLRTFKIAHGDDLSRFAEFYAVQLNDTHPAMSIPELIRLLMLEGMSFDDAFNVAQKTFSYTNHTVMGEALEKWPLDLMRSVVPEIVDIICRIDQKLKWEHPGLFIVKDNTAHMANLSIYVGSYINGVAEIHTQILKDDCFKDWYYAFPERFQNKTNGITPRRWLGLCNPELTAMLREKVGGDFLKNLDLIGELKNQIYDETVVEFNDIKHLKKEQLCAVIAKHEGVTLNPDFIFDVQVKRLHEYKRQMLNILHIISLYHKLKDNPDMAFVPRTYIFGSKAAPGYAVAKKTIQLINSISNMIENDPAVRDKLKVVFIEDYKVSLAEMIMPAAEVSEQISIAGKEASGTGNMKFMMNGALTIGTMDGANVEICEAVGRDNIFIFGMETPEAEALAASGNYEPMLIYQNDPVIRRVLDQLIRGFGDGVDYTDIANLLLHGGNGGPADRYMSLKDFASYAEAQQRVSEAYRDQEKWNRMALMNIANSGRFAADRSIAEYAQNIWRVKTNFAF